MSFGDGRERRPLWSKWLVNEKVDESFKEVSRQNEGQQDQTKGPGQQRCHAPCQPLLQPLARQPGSRSRASTPSSLTMKPRRREDREHSEEDATGSSFNQSNK